MESNILGRVHHPLNEDEPQSLGPWFESSERGGPESIRSMLNELLNRTVKRRYDLLIVMQRHNERIHIPESWPLRKLPSIVPIRALRCFA